MVDFEKQVTPNQTVVLRLHGNIDEPSCSYIFDRVADLIESGRKLIVIDCEDLGDTSGIAFELLVRCRFRVHRGGTQIVLAGIENEFVHMLAWLHFDRIFNIYPTARQAVNTLELRFQTARI